MAAASYISLDQSHPRPFSRRRRRDAADYIFFGDVKHRNKRHLVCRLCFLKCEINVALISALPSRFYSPHTEGEH